MPQWVYWKERNCRGRKTCSDRKVDGPYRKTFRWNTGSFFGVSNQKSERISVVFLLGKLLKRNNGAVVTLKHHRHTTRAAHAVCATRCVCICLASSSVAPGASADSQTCYEQDGGNPCTYTPSRVLPRRRWRGEVGDYKTDILYMKHPCQPTDEDWGFAQPRRQFLKG